MVSPVPVNWTKIQDELFLTVYEIHCRNYDHVPFNSSFLLTLCLTYPQKKILFIAEASHLKNIITALKSYSLPNLTFTEAEAGSFRHSVIKSLVPDYLLISRLIQHSLKSRVNTVIILSVNTTILFWVKVFSISRKELKFVLIPHSILETIGNTNHKRIWNKLFNFKRVFLWKNLPNIRYLLLGQSIYLNLCKVAPTIKKSCMAIKHPYIYRKNDAVLPNDEIIFGYDEIIFGYIGTAHRNKGFDTFIKIAEEISKHETPVKVKFVCIGKLVDKSMEDDLSTSSIEFKGGSNETISMDDYNFYISQITFAVYPFKADSYKYYASGSILDAFSHLKPVICLKTDYTEMLFKDMQHPGYLCADPEHMLSVIKRIVWNFSKERYCEQISLIRSNREMFSPIYLSSELKVLLSNFIEE